MRARRLRLVLGTAVLVAAVGALSSVVVPAHAAGVLAAAFSKDSDWGSGYQGRYTIANGTAAGISSWKVEFDLPAGTTVGSFWDALVTRSGTHVTAVNRDYNGTVVAGASVSFGFIVSGSGVPSGCTLNGGPCAGVADNTPPTAPAGLHATG